MMVPRRRCLNLAASLLAMAALAACARTAPPAPLVSGTSTPPMAASRPAAMPWPAVPHPDAAPVQPPMPAPASRPAAMPQPMAPHPDAAPAQPPMPAPASRPAAMPQPMAPHPDVVTVQPGETLYAISRRYDVPVRSLIEANGLQPPYSLNAGRRLAVPQLRQHIVQPGETLYSVSRLYGVDTSSLAGSNGLEPPYVVRVGQPLVLPAPVETAGARAPTPVIQAAVPAAAPVMPMAVTRSELPPPPAAAPPPAPVSRTAAVAPPPAPSQNGGRSFLWPVHGRIVAGYGGGEGGTHNDGINIAAPRGASVLAADGGIVAYAGNELRGYGNLVLIKHPGGWMTAYAHNSALLVKRGERVRRGQAIARVGATGAVGEPQLHFEIRHGARALDPGDYLPSPAATAAKG